MILRRDMPAVVVFTFLLWVSDSAAVANLVPEVTKTETADPTRILFVGNSYLYYNNSLHDHVKRMVAAAGIHDSDDLIFKSVTINGGTLLDHDISDYLEPGKFRMERPFQVVVLQGHSKAALLDGNRARFAEAVTGFSMEVAAAGGETALYMTHAYVLPHEMYRDDMIRDIENLYVTEGNEVGALVIPIGLAFEEAYRRRPDLQLHMPYDGTHPSLAGTYLAAATVFASLYGRSPLGVQYDYFGRIDGSTVRFLQEVAEHTVRAFYGHN
ncbi:MAG: hypothetical protein OXH06_18105 [Gemmatimonadetes bacterium]|nr:hypothetical protein [Gemmatimonadota bacterium]